MKICSEKNSNHLEPHSRLPTWRPRNILAIPCTSALDVSDTWTSFARVSAFAISTIMHRRGHRFVDSHSFVCDSTSVSFNWFHVAVGWSAWNCNGSNIQAGNGNIMFVRWRCVRYTGKDAMLGMRKDRSSSSSNGHLYSAPQWYGSDDVWGIRNIA